MGPPQRPGGEEQQVLEHREAVEQDVPQTHPQLRPDHRRVLLQAPAIDGDGPGRGGVESCEQDLQRRHVSGGTGVGCAAALTTRRPQEHLHPMGTHTQPPRQRLLPSETKAGQSLVDMGL